MPSPFNPEYLVVMKRSERASPLSWIATPASYSFLYDCAVSVVKISSATPDCRGRTNVIETDRKRLVDLVG